LHIFFCFPSSKPLPARALVSLDNQTRGVVKQADWWQRGSLLGLLKAPPNWATFDARVFALPRDEVIHYFIWRQQDWIRNSLNMLALFYFSQLEVHKLTRSQLHDKLFREKGVNWAHLPTHLKNGTCVYKVPFMVREPAEMAPSVIRSTWMIDRETPVFTRDRAYIERHVNIDVQPLVTAPQIEK
jgi:tRNA(His) 5'-end guanylyltransferase